LNRVSVIFIPTFRPDTVASEQPDATVSGCFLNPDEVSCNVHKTSV